MVAERLLPLFPTPFIIPLTPFVLPVFLAPSPPHAQIVISTGILSNASTHHLNTCPHSSGKPLRADIRYTGTTKDFCEITGDGTPGTGTCVSNCGMDIINNNTPPSEYRRIGYFEAWNVDRDCLWMDASSIDENQFTHIHFAFADVTPDFRVDISKVQAQFDKFKALKKSKRIVAFGGWAASTSTTTFQIFRDGGESTLQCLC